MSNILTCVRCGVPKPDTDFSPNKWMKSGRASKCHLCCNAYAKELRERKPEWAKQINKQKYARWRAKNPPTPKVQRETADGRLCTTCKTRKPRSEFGSLKAASDGLNSRCRSCVRESSLKYKYKNPAEFAARARAKSKRRYSKNRDALVVAQRAVNLSSRYGMSIGRREALWHIQGRLCPICANPIIIPNGKLAKNSAVIDHCHATGEIRGLLCMTCNQALGFLADDLDRLRRAAEYLASPPARQLP